MAKKLFHLKIFLKEGEARPADLETIFFDFEVSHHDITINIISKAKQQLWENLRNYPDLFRQFFLGGYGGGGLSGSSLSWLWSWDTISSSNIYWPSLCSCVNTPMQDLCEMLSYLILPKVEFGTGPLLSSKYVTSVWWSDCICLFVWRLGNKRILSLLKDSFDPK